jgi:hypothetical protein
MGYNDVVSCMSQHFSSLSYTNWKSPCVNYLIYKIPKAQHNDLLPNDEKR